MSLVAGTIGPNDDKEERSEEKSRMSMWTAIVLIVVAAIAGEAWRNHVKTKRASPNREAQEALEALHRKVDALDRDLRERVETLERIVTDDKADLKREFDRLDKTA
jgi:hypothetical protein